MGPPGLGPNGPLPWALEGPRALQGPPLGPGGALPWALEGPFPWALEGPLPWALWGPLQIRKKDRDVQVVGLNGEKRTWGWQPDWDF